MTRGAELASDPARICSQGSDGVCEAEPVEDRRVLPPAIRQAILHLAAEYPDFHATELATICDVRFNRRPSAHTIKQV